MKKKIVTAGHLCIDITPLFPDRQFALDEVFVPGKLTNTNGVDIHTGGAVANVGLAMKFLGADVKLMGKIGDDEFGRMILKILEKYGYLEHQDMIITRDQGTSYSMVLAVPGHDRIFLHSPGANDTFCYDDLDFDAISDAALFHFGYPSLMRRTYLQNGEELVKIFRKVKSLGVATSLDMAAVDPASEAGQADWKKIIERVMPYVDFFVPSVEELCFMMDRPRYEEWNQRANSQDVTLFLDPEKDVKPLADELITMGAKVLMIKCGVPGIYYRTADAETLSQIGCKAGLDAKQWAEKEGFEHSYQPDQIKSGTGAGDTSIAAFLTAMLDGRTPEKCLQLAAGTGASCVEAYDAFSGLRSFEELEKKIENGWEKIYISR